MRSAGQAIFLAGNVALLFCLLYTFRLSRRELGRIHPTLLLLTAAWPLLIVRGVYGLLQATNTLGALRPFVFTNVCPDDCLVRQFLLRRIVRPAAQTANVSLTHASQVCQQHALAEFCSRGDTNGARARVRRGR
jgi:hypothetical protein